MCFPTVRGIASLDRPLQPEPRKLARERNNVPIPFRPGDHFLKMEWCLRRDEPARHCFNVISTLIENETALPVPARDSGHMTCCLVPERLPLDPHRYHRGLSNRRRRDSQGVAIMVDTARARFPEDMTGVAQFANSSTLESMANDALDRVKQSARDEPLTFALWACEIGFVLG